MEIVSPADWQKRVEELDSFLRGQNCIVTGINGFLGSHLGDELLARGANVFGISSGRKTPNFDSFNLRMRTQCITIDLSDYKAADRVEDAINAERIDAVYHLAARAIVGKAADSPLATFNDNVVGTISVLEACRRARSVKMIVLASSDKQYGPRRDVPYVEKYAPRGVHIYDATKGAADLLAHAYWFQYGLPIRIIRAGNLYGPGDLNFSRLIPRTTMRLLSGVAPLVRGGQGEVQREYVHVRDAARAYMLAAKAVAESPDNILPAPEDAIGVPAYNIGSRDVLTTLQMIRMISKTIGSDLDPKEVPQTSASHFELPNQSLDDSKIRQEIGWQPTVSLRKGLGDTVDWYRNYHVELVRLFGAEIFDGSSSEGNERKRRVRDWATLRSSEGSPQRRKTAAH